MPAPDSSRPSAALKAATQRSWASRIFTTEAQRSRRRDETNSSLPSVSSVSLWLNLLDSGFTAGMTQEKNRIREPPLRLRLDREDEFVEDVVARIAGRAIQALGGGVGALGRELDADRTAGAREIAGPVHQPPPDALAAMGRIDEKIVQDPDRPH